MGGAHSLFHFVLQPQWEPAVGAGLPVPPPTGQSENHSRRPPETGRHMGVNEVNFFLKLGCCSNEDATGFTFTRFPPNWTPILDKCVRQRFPTPSSNHHMKKYRKIMMFFLPAESHIHPVFSCTAQALSNCYVLCRLMVFVQNDSHHFPEFKLKQIWPELEP